MINILIRTSNRPEQFKLCIDSILKQSYQNFKIICCYDDEKSKEYINFNDNRILSYFINLDNCQHYKYNLYCNFLLSKVNDGWIMFLDDDDMLSDNNALQTIMNYTDSNNNLIFWKVLIKNKEIYPKNTNNINVGEIANSGFCFHSKFKGYSKWKCGRKSDLYFIKNMQNKIKFKNIFINKVFVKTQVGPNRGKKLNIKNLSDFNIKNMYISKQRYSEYFDFELYNKESKEPCIFVGINNINITTEINSYNGYSYVLVLNEREIMNLRYIKKNKNIKILLSHNLNQYSYIYFLHNNICSLHYDVIYTNCK
jgi:hypothetical protein